MTVANAALERATTIRCVTRTRPGKSSGLRVRSARGRAKSQRLASRERPAGWTTLIGPLDTLAVVARRGTKAAERAWAIQVWGFIPSRWAQNTPVHSDSHGHGTSPRIRILGVELCDGTGRRRYDADLAKSGLSLRVATVAGQVSDRRKLPDIGALAAVHFKRAGRRSELDHEGVDILSDEFLAEPSDDFLARCGTTSQRGAERHDSQNTHVADPPTSEHPSATGGRGQYCTLP
jgi:hypothetical protein